MRKRQWWLIGLLTVGVALAPVLARAQDFPAADPIFPEYGGLALPIYDRPGAGVFVSGEFVMFRQTVPLEHQPIAFTGFYDADGSISGHVGRLIGTRTPVLFADDASGPGSYQPGFRLGVGYRWDNGASVNVTWMHLAKSRYNATASLARPHFVSGHNLANSFLSAPVFNFPTEYAGPVTDPNDAFRNFDTGVGNPGATYGIWNAADLMTVIFEQRTDSVEAAVRYPIFETENWRSYGIVGPRFFWIWERFKWRTVDLSTQGTAGPTDVGIYTNIVSNRMYGAHVGWGNEWWLGNGFAFSVDLGAAALLDVVKERAKYQLEARNIPPQNKRSITDWKLVPEVTAKANVWWYPIPGIQIRAGYNFMGFLNTIGAKEPVSYNWGAIDPAWEKVNRWFDGFEAGMAIIF